MKASIMNATTNDKNVSLLSSLRRTSLIIIEKQECLLPLSTRYRHRYHTPPALPLVACVNGSNPLPRTSGNVSDVAGLIFAQDTSTAKPGACAGSMTLSLAYGKVSQINTMKRP
jgi:hypothetical protein